MRTEQVRAIFNSALTSRTMALVFTLGLNASMAGAQSAPSTGSSAVQAPAQSAGNVASGRVTETVAPPLPGAPGLAPSPAGAMPVAATATTESGSNATPTEAATPTPAPVTPKNTGMDAEQAMLTAQAMDIVAPILNYPVESAGLLLAFMLVLAALIYRRHQRSHAQASSLNSIGHDQLEDLQKSPPTDPPWLGQLGLQAEIMALDLELGPSEASIPKPMATAQTATSQLSGHDLNLHKLQWSEQLLAAGENELARVLLTSVAESLRKQLQPTEASTRGMGQ